MTIYTDRIVLVFPIPKHGDRAARSAAASLQTLEITDSGREFETLVPLDPAAIGEYAESFALSVVQERDTLAEYVKTLTLERDAALSSAEAVRAEMQTEIDRLTALVSPAVDPDAVPSTITRTQARLVLLRAGLLDAVLEVIKAGGVESQIWYEANEWNRNSPVLAGMAQALGFTEEQVDNLFREAGAIIL